MEEGGQYGHRTDSTWHRNLVRPGVDDHDFDHDDHVHHDGDYGGEHGHRQDSP